jgi:hypothetical protein
MPLEPGLDDWVLVATEVVADQVDLESVGIWSSILGQELLELGGPVTAV